jgi:hypothetical protein
MHKWQKHRQTAFHAVPHTCSNQFTGVAPAAAAAAAIGALNPPLDDTGRPGTGAAPLLAPAYAVMTTQQHKTDQGSTKQAEVCVGG